VDQGEAPTFTLHAAFRPKGVLGFVYWRLLGPIHRWAFGQMTDHRISRALKSQVSAAD